MTEVRDCRFYGALGFGLSALLHAAVAALLFWLSVSLPSEGSIGEQEVALTLAMFEDGGGASPDSAAGPEASNPDNERVPDASETSRPDSTEDSAQPVATPAKPETLPLPLPAEKVATESAPAPRLETKPPRKPEVAPNPQPKTEAKPNSEPDSKPTPKPKPKPRPKPEAKPKPAVVQRPPPKLPVAKPATRAATSASTRPKQRSSATQAAKRADSGSSTSRSSTTGDDRTAAAKSAGSGGAASAAAKRRAESGYLSELQRALSRRRYYPRSAQQRGLEGTASVQFTISAGGSFSGIGVSTSSGTSELDKAAVTTVKRLGKFKPIPKSTGRTSWTVRVPIVYRLK